jgi:hypothetical protein
MGADSSLEPEFRQQDGEQRRQKPPDPKARKGGNPSEPCGRHITRCSECEWRQASSAKSQDGSQRER